MDKDYKKWMAAKSVINNSKSRPIGYKKREIWICSVGENIGHEEDGKGTWFVRPALVIRKYGADMCFVVPLSTTSNRGVFHYPFDGHTGKTSVALLSQSRVIDSARFRRKIGKADITDFDEIRRRLKELLL
jgi:mRNA-degrading endonuclease toxin of MazEF toxin-antitoxin module